MGIHYHMAVQQNSVTVKFPFLAAVFLITKMNLAGKATSPERNLTQCRQEMRYKIQTLDFYISRTVRFLLSLQFLLTITELLEKCSGQLGFTEVALKQLHLVGSSSSVLTGSLNFQILCISGQQSCSIQIYGAERPGMAAQNRNFIPIFFQTFKFMEQHLQRNQLF